MACQGASGSRPPARLLVPRASEGPAGLGSPPWSDAAGEMNGRISSTSSLHLDAIKGVRELEWQTARSSRRRFRPRYAAICAGRSLPTSWFAEIRGLWPPFRCQPVVPARPGMGPWPRSLSRRLAAFRLLACQTRDGRTSAAEPIQPRHPMANLPPPAAFPAGAPIGSAGSCDPWARILAGRGHARLRRDSKHAAGLPRPALQTVVEKLAREARLLARNRHLRSRRCR